jgi:hypothetical protein
MVVVVLLVVVVVVVRVVVVVVFDVVIIIIIIVIVVLAVVVKPSLQISFPCISFIHSYLKMFFNFLNAESDHTSFLAD